MANVSVIVRCRPVLPSEVHLTRTKIECNEIDATVRIQSSMQQNTDKVFKFNQVLPETSNQDDVFEAYSPLIDSALDGLHATCFCYGQTGSGKTYSMEGLDYIVTNTGSEAAGSSKQVIKPDLNTPKERHGIVLRTMEALFERARSRQEQSGSPEDGGRLSFRIRCSFVQLYNEKLTDLITKRTNLKLRWTSHGTFAVDGLSRSQVEEPEQARELFFLAARNKAMGSHLMNQQSSRSHCIYTFYIDQWYDDTPENVIRSELALVDLAGSEKLAMLAENPSAQLLKESIDINTSLLALGKVITALALRSEGKISAAQLNHIPYRESKLTKLLQHSLGGNAVACMIACITPLDSYVDESMSTLMYAGRARNIKNDPRINEDPRATLIRQLREENTLLKAELNQYRQFVLDGNENNAEIALKLGKAGNNNNKLANLQQQQLITSNDSNDQQTLPTSPSKSTQGLAEKLLSSCAMLKEVIGVNGKLREAFDNMHMLKKKAERREAELEAENLGLRERIEVLESIALQDEIPSSSSAQQNNHLLMTTNNNQSSNGDQNETDSANSSSYQNTPLRQSNNSGVVQKQQQQNFQRKNSGGANFGLQPPHSNSAPSSAKRIEHPSFLPEVETPNNNQNNNKNKFQRTFSGGPQDFNNNNNDNNNNIRSSSSGYNFNTRTQQTSFGGGINNSRPSSQEGRSMMHAHSATLMTPTKPSFASSSSASYQNQQQQQVRSSSSSNNNNKTKQLREYAKKYKNRPDWIDQTSYSKYYNIAQEKQKERGAGVDKKIRELTKQLPQETLNMLPSSAQKTTEFGQLAFGSMANLTTGGQIVMDTTSVSDLEEKRRQRQQRLAQLQERQRLLQQGGSSAAAYIQSQDGGAGGLLMSGASSNHTLGSGTTQQQQQQYQRENSSSVYSSNVLNPVVVRGGGFPSNHISSNTPRSVGNGLTPNTQFINNNNNTNTIFSQQQQQQQHAGTPLRSNQGATTTGTPFQYLSQTEVTSAFTEEQLAILKQRASNLSPKAATQQRNNDTNSVPIPVRGSAMREW